MRKSIKKIFALTLLVSSLGLCACMRERTIASAELSKNYTKKTTQSLEVGKEFTSALSNFSFSLFQKSIEKNGKNQLLSPLSAYLCLALLQNGANGETKTELESALGMPSQTLNSSLYAYISSLPKSKACSLSIGNSLWFKENGLQVSPEFLQTNADYFSAQAYASPFDQSTVQDINNWCYNHTGGKIEKLLDTISPDALLYVINTLDFESKWATPYQKNDIKKGIFKTDDGETQETVMLHSKESVYFSTKDALGFSRPYAGNDYSFMAFLPKETDAFTFAQTLSAERFKALLASGEQATVQVQMPEFSYESELDFTKTMRALGIQNLFDPMKADLGKISPSQPLYCSAVKQKVMIQVDRNGTKAAAITWGEVKTTMLPHDEIYITLDRPFVYAIVENSTGIPLFLGILNRV
jgi:serpin B